VRPEWHRLVSDSTALSGDNVLPGTIREISFQGDQSLALVALQHGGEARVALPHEGAADQPWRPGDRVGLAWRPEDGQLLQ
jgi:ABC-type Fe3+/spermidine/putrescine transport system ATPase subunit